MPLPSGDLSIYYITPFKTSTSKITGIPAKQTASNTPVKMLSFETQVDGSVVLLTNDCSNPLQQKG